MTVSTNDIARMARHLAAFPLEVASELVLAATDICVMVDAGLRVQAVFVGAALQDVSCDGWEGAPLRSLVSPEAQRKIDLLWQDDAIAITGWRHLNFRTDRADESLPLLIRRIASSDGASVLLGRDLRPAVRMQEQFNSVMIEMEQSYQDSLDDPFEPQDAGMTGNGNGNGAAADLHGAEAQSKMLVSQALGALGRQPVAQIISHTAKVLEDMCIREAYAQSQYDLHRTAELLGMDADELAQRLVFVTRKG